MRTDKILVIDDDPNSVREIKDIFEPIGYEVCFALDAEDGLKKIKSQRPNLILLDLVLPDQSGFKVAQEIKSDPRLKDIPIIAISLKRDDIDKHIAAKSGASEYFEKPVDYDKLTYTVKEILGKKGQD